MHDSTGLFSHSVTDRLIKLNKHVSFIIRICVLKLTPYCRDCHIFAAYVIFQRRCGVFLSLVYMHNIHPGANIHPGCKFAPGCILVM